MLLKFENLHGLSRGTDTVRQCRVVQRCRSLVNFCTVVLLSVVHDSSCSKENGSNLVDSASSHTLVSKIKPCTSKYKYITVKLRMAHYISYSLFDSPLLLG